MEYTYSLQKYTGRNSRHTCPACGRKFCFTLYVDGNNNPIAEDVGRCEHRNSCGYEKTPKDYFSENPTELKEFRPIQAPQPRKEEKARLHTFFFDTTKRKHQQHIDGLPTEVLR